MPHPVWAVFYDTMQLWISRWDYPLETLLYAYIHCSNLIYSIFPQRWLYHFDLNMSLNCKSCCSTCFQPLWMNTFFFIRSMLISSLKYFEWTCLMMHFSASWIWLQSSKSIFKKKKKIFFTFSFFLIIMLCFLLWLTFCLSTNIIICFNFNQEECLLPKHEKSALAVADLTFFCVFHPR